MANLVLGPLLRFVSEDGATVWVETDAACTVGVLGCSARTFAVEGHHYALVVVEGLAPASETPYAVHLDGELAWPPADSPLPPSVIRTHDPDRPFRLAFGSCRVATGPRRSARDKLGVDALQTYAVRMAESRDRADCPWPDALLMVGDQVYADEPSPRTVEFIRSRRDTDREPGVEVADFEEYTRLYQESWSDPEIRWLLSTVPTAMIFDDHDIHDDWNTSRAWRDEHEATHWWRERIVGGLMAYWLYQHLGNLSPADLAQDALYKDVVAAGDAGRLLRDHATYADSEADTGHGPRWSYLRDFGHARLLVIDSRCGRRLTPGDRAMTDDAEWDWVVEKAHGDVDHLLLATSLPWLLPPAVHYLELWNEAVCDGAWGARFARLGEKIRQAADLEHWAAFRRSFDALADLVADIGSGHEGGAPATVVALSGDVHHAYLAEAAYPPARAVRSRVFQATCSPLHNPVEPALQLVNKAASSRPGIRVGRWLARRAGVGPSPVEWRLTHGPHFGNEIATLELEGRRATLSVERAAARRGGGAELRPVFSTELSPAADRG